MDKPQKAAAVGPLQQVAKVFVSMWRELLICAAAILA